MTTKQLIEVLNDLDPSGNLLVVSADEEYCATIKSAKKIKVIARDPSTCVLKEVSPYVALSCRVSND